MKGPEKCLNKKRYNSEEEAQAAARYQMKAFPTTPDLRVYRCPYCPSWHLTSQEASHG